MGINISEDKTSIMTMNGTGISFRKSVICTHKIRGNGRIILTTSAFRVRPDKMVVNMYDDGK